VKKWFRGHLKEAFYLSVITLGEIRRGIELKRRSDADRAARLEKDLEALIEEYADNILPVDDEVVDLWGRLNCPESLPTTDSLIAATAMAHDLVVVTRNVKDFKRTPVTVVNPFG
jgi:predicted nucleic acid-binding protein